MAGDPYIIMSVLTTRHVSIRARAWRAMTTSVDYTVVDDVSIRARAWRAMSIVFSPSRPTKRFNPRPRMAGDEQVRNLIAVTLEVSIRARA